MSRRIGFPTEFLGLEPRLFCDPELQVPQTWAPRGRWKSGAMAMHTFCDDYRQEFFWRRPMEGLLVADVAGWCTAPDFSVYADDPSEWANYQVWRSALVAAFWQAAGVCVLPVVAFRGSPERFVEPGSAWAIRGPSRGAELGQWRQAIREWELRARPGRLVVFGNQCAADGAFAVPMVGRPLFSSKGLAAQKEVCSGRA